MDDASSGFTPAPAGDETGVLATGRRYIASIVGRKAAPNGVERKSVGRSMQNLVKIMNQTKTVKSSPLMNRGMLPPVRNPTQSSVNELQLKSIIHEFLSIPLIPSRYYT